MSQIILVTSGKGGVGKSSCCALLGAALAHLNHRVLIIELDSGLRGLDIMLGVHDQTVYDLYDVVCGRCEPIRAIVQCDYCTKLYLIPASNSRLLTCDQTDLIRLCKGLSQYYDYILLDTPAGIGHMLEVAATVADRALVLTTPDPIAVRDAQKASSLLREYDLNAQRLVINRVGANFRRLELMPDLDAVIDGVGVQLIAVVAEDVELVKALARGRAVPPESASAKIFAAMARRVVGQYVPLLIRS